MASITFDGQSLVLDGRRIWLVSGSIPYFRIPRSEWANRIHAAKLAGLNTIETPVIWARHEPRPGQFDFTGENDLRHFVELVGSAGLQCILRPGPFVGMGLDLGGLPPWLLSITGIRLRAASAPFLEACSRYITAVAHQVRDLQASTPRTASGRGAAGKQPVAPAAPAPIVLIQSESGWTCGDDPLATSYLGELDRYWREAGITVPVINANDLWQSVEGEIDGWTGFADMLSHLRQLASVRPTQPRIVIDMAIGRFATWGRRPEAPREPDAVIRALAEVLAAGGQFNLSPFCGGTNFGFSAGRDPSGPEAFATTSNDSGAPLTELGMPGPALGAVRRICTFASSFSRLLSHIEPVRQPVVLRPSAATSGNGAVSVVHASGPQGSVVFVFGDGRAESAGPLTLLLPDGSTLPVEVREQPVAWCLFDTRLTGRSHLDYCNLSAFTLVGKVLVCYGPAGARGVLSINGSPLEVPVPSGSAPLVHEHEGITVVVASQEQIDAIHAGQNEVFIGVSGLDTRGQPIPHEQYKTCTRLDAEGVASTHRFGAAAAKAPAPSRGPRITLGEWMCASEAAHLDGSSARYASIEKPSDLISLGSPYGYGWYRARIASSKAHSPVVMFPHAGHRLHLTLDDSPAGLVGVGPGAARSATLALKRKPNTLVVLAENLGRVCGGADLGESVGLFGHAWAVKPLRVTKPRLVASEPVDLLAFRAPLWRVHRDDTTDPGRLTWTLGARKRSPIIMWIGDFDAPPGGAGAAGIVLLNDRPIHFFQTGGVAPIFLDPNNLSRGKNVIQISLVGPTAEAKDLARSVSFFEAQECITAKAEWAFARWEPPAPDAFDRPGRTHRPGRPAWWRSAFTAPTDDTPVMLDAAGLSKGQIYVNSNHVGRYFVSTAAGKSVPPQKKYLIPRQMLSPGEPNDLVIFDEHGASPARCRLIADRDAAAIEG